MSLRLRKRKITWQLLAESGGTVTEQFGAKDDRFVWAMAAGKRGRVSAIRSSDRHQVMFETGDTFEPDLVLFCTEFETRLPYIEEGIWSAGRYLHTLLPKAGESLGFIGLPRPAFGATPPLAELQARWFALVQSGECCLPSGVQMNESLERRKALHRRVFRPVGERLHHFG